MRVQSISLSERQLSSVQLVREDAERPPVNSLQVHAFLHVVIDARVEIRIPQARDVRGSRNDGLGYSDYVPNSIGTYYQSK